MIGGAPVILLAPAQPRLTSWNTVAAPRIIWLFAYGRPRGDARAIPSPVRGTCPRGHTRPEPRAGQLTRVLSGILFFLARVATAERGGGALARMLTVTRER